MGKHLLLLHSRFPADPLHLPPDHAAVHRRPLPGNKDNSISNALFFAVGKQHPAKLIGKIQHPGLSLIGHTYIAVPHSLDGNKGQLADPQPGAA